MKSEIQTPIAESILTAGMSGPLISDLPLALARFLLTTGAGAEEALKQDFLVRTAKPQLFAP